MVARGERAALVGGTFSDAAHAQEALEGLLRSTRVGGDLDVAFLGSNGEFTLLAQTRTSHAHEQALRVLREHDALLEPNVGRLVAATPDVLMHGAAASGKTAVLARWLEAFFLLQDLGLLGPADLLALVIARRGEIPEGRDRRPSAEERRRRLAAADAELRAVSERLAAALRAEQPDLFTRHGRLRRSALSRRVIERAGGRRRLPGADLRALEDAADAGAARAAHAP